ncbi:hypothetical protein [Listeria booriae]|uniref:hypothetical protein n=1 Tax=Listeria booriae TaxID=1552123 RepID=UPI0016275C28|nr:hypothetical protein [Listeria booriae]MBC2304252.1 hypothetical protein [Listeria booriae]
MSKRVWTIVVAVVSIVIVSLVVFRINQVNANKIPIETRGVKDGETLRVANLEYTFGDIEMKMAYDDMNQKLIEYHIPVKVENLSSGMIEIPVADFVALYSNYRSGLYSVYLDEKHSAVEPVVKGQTSKKGYLIFMTYVDKYIEHDDAFRLYFTNNTGQKIIRYKIDSKMQ